MVAEKSDLPEVQDFLKALASETRQKILFLFVGRREYTVNQVALEVGIGQSTASEHLALLKRARLLKARREGKEVYYSPDRDSILHLLQKFTDLVTRCCP